jgi:DNA repair exonuclease SbcCD ATPase subunit
MKIHEFSFRNICSYGNKLQTFKFTDEPRLILVQGKNGSGKSSISDALTVAIYGKSAIRKTKEIPNRINKNAYTQIKFTTGNGRLIDIERGLEPNFSKLSIDGAEYNLPDKRRVDDFIEEELTKLPFNVFSNTISLSVNDFKSFVKLSPADKRQIIDKIFGLDIVNDMSKISKEDTKRVKGEITPLESSIASNQRLLESSVNQLENLKNEIQATNTARIEELNIELKKLVDLKESARVDAGSFTTELSKIQTIVRTSRDELTTIRANISEIQKKLDLYNKNKCPHCLSDLTDEIHSQIKDKLLKLKESQESSIPDISQTIKSNESSLSLIESDQNKAKDKFYKIDAQVSTVKREIQQLSQQGKQTSDKHLVEVIKNIETEIGTAGTSLAIQTEKLKVSQEMEMILSDNGMKRMLMSQIIPLLNKKILKTAKVLEFKFAFEFDLEFNPIITHLGMQVSPDSLSSGEQKKMNLIVLLCILELIKLKHNKVNLLFLDEVFSSLDVDSIFRVVDLLKTFSKKYNMTVFVISHDPLPEEYFDTKIQVENTDHFSDLTII